LGLVEAKFYDIGLLGSLFSGDHGSSPAIWSDVCMLAQMPVNSPVAYHIVSHLVDPMHTLCDMYSEYSCFR
jgi:hypothetical protein